MGSGLRQTRIMQKEQFLRRLVARKTALIEQGTGEEKIKKDNVVKNLLGEIKRTNRAIAAIDSREQVIQKAKLQKQERIAKAAEEAPKAKKEKQKDKTAPVKEGKKEKKQKQKETET